MTLPWAHGPSAGYTRARQATLAEEILFGALEEGGTVSVGLKKSELVFDYEGRPSTEAGTEETVEA